jgi:hypothetical protein
MPDFIKKVASGMDQDSGVRSALTRRSEFFPTGIDAALPRGANALLPIFISLIILWSPLVCYWLGLRASSSVSASILSMMNFGAGLFGILTPESSKLVAVALIFVGVFYYFYSTKTWQAYEIFWFNEQRQKLLGEVVDFEARNKP